MKNTLTLLFCLALGLNMFAQPIAPCGNAEHGLDSWYQHFLRHQSQYQSRRSTVEIFMPVTIHNVAQDNGTGRLGLAQILEQFCVLNTDYDSANIHYFINWPIRNINNSGFASHPDIVAGAQFMLQYKVPGTMNSFICASAAGNCGYNMKYAGNIMAHSCMSGHTWSHEVGHYMNVQHPFLGWEGKRWDAITPTPRQVRADYTNFHDSIVGRDTIIWDTLDVELTDRTNCLTSADHLCDTYSDYISYRWQCTGTNSISNELQTDPNGVQFRSEGNLIMSYSGDACQRRFSPDQITLGRAYINDNRQDHLWNQNPDRDTINTAVQYVSPINGAIVPIGRNTMTWRAVPGATHYLVQIGRGTTFNVLLEEALVSDTTWTPNFSFANTPNPTIRPRWRVKPVNAGYTCAPFSPIQIFEPSTASGIDGIDGSVEKVMLYPNPSGLNELVTLGCSSKFAQDATLSVYTITGQMLSQQQISLGEGENLIDIQTNLATKGVYVVRLATANGALTQRLLVD